MDEEDGRGLRYAAPLRSFCVVSALVVRRFGWVYLGRSSCVSSNSFSGGGAPIA